MEFYFDLGFINEFHVKPLNGDFSENFRKFAGQLNGSRIYIITESNIKTTKELLDQYPLLRLIFNCGGRPNFINNEEIKQKLNHPNTSGFKCFFINDYSAKNLREDYGYFAVNFLEAQEDEKLFSRDRQDLKKIPDKDNTGEEFFNSWAVLKSFQYPINSIIITDQFIFSKITDEHLKINILSILENIGLKRLNKCRVEIIILTSEIENEIRLKEIYELIKSSLNRLIGKDEFHLTICKFSKSKNVKKIHDLHFRHIFTNFLSIESHNSFTFFKKDKNNNIIPRSQEPVNFEHLIWKSAITRLRESSKAKKNAFEAAVEEEKEGIKDVLLSNNPSRNSKLL